MVEQIAYTNLTTLILGSAALVLLMVGDRLLPGKPIALGVVALSIVVVTLFNLTQAGVAVTGAIPPGLPVPEWPAIRLRDQDGIVALALGCALLAYIEGVAAARTFAVKHRQTIDPRRELIGLAAANFATAAVGGYPVAGGLSQTAVNEGAGARSRMSLVFASVTLGICLVSFTSLVANLPKAVLAAVVLMAVSGLIDVRAIVWMWRVSRVDFLNALMALIGTLLLGILQGILLAALISVLLILALSSTPHVAVLGRIRGTRQYSDLTRHPENEPLIDVLAVRPEASLLYLNAEFVQKRILALLQSNGTGAIRNVLVDLSAAPRMDLAGARMLGDLHEHLRNREIGLIITGAHGQARDIMRAEGLDTKVRGISRGSSFETVLEELLNVRRTD